VGAVKRNDKENERSGYAIRDDAIMHTFEMYHATHRRGDPRKLNESCVKAGKRTREADSVRPRSRPEKAL
jgi:hypothetical protein